VQRSGQRASADDSGVIMEENIMKNYWIWLSTIKGIGPVTARKLLDYFTTPEKIYYAEKRKLLEVKDIGETTAERVINSKSLRCAEEILERCHRHDIKILTLEDQLYPTSVKSISNMPLLLYYRGQLIKNSVGVGIVGTRRCTEYGKRAAVDAAEFLAKHNIPVISGMAKGIDSYAHTSCLISGGYTIAILGNGLDICYPREHGELMKKLIDNGCVISEYPPGTKPIAEHFPERNKIIAAWSKKLLVVEAGEKSGALITSEYAKRFKRKVFAVPSSIYSKEGIGSNRLLQKDAEMYFSPAQLLEELINEDFSADKSSTNVAEISISQTPLEYKIMQELRDKSLTLDELILLFEDYKQNLIETISIMELEGKIKAKIGGKLALP
jgi:DNA processing protein